MSKVSLNQLTISAHADFNKLFKKIMGKALEYNKKYPRDDARREFFMAFGELNAWLLIQLDDFLGTLDRTSDKIKKYMILSDDDRTQFLLQCDTITRSSYLTKLMFDVEYFVKTVMSKMSQPTNDNYHILTKKFLKFLDVYDIQKHKILNLPAQIRNSLHNNGYTNYDIDVTLRGIHYQATIGQRLNFTCWNNVYVVCDELTDLLIYVIENSKINQENHIPLK